MAIKSKWILIESAKNENYLSQSGAQTKVVATWTGDYSKEHILKYATAYCQHSNMDYHLFEMTGVFNYEVPSPPAEWVFEKVTKFCLSERREENE